MTPCHYVSLDQLFDLADAPEEAPELAAHVAACPPCSAWLAQQRDHGRALRALAHRSASGTLRGRIMGAARDAAFDVLAKTLQALYLTCAMRDQAMARGTFCPAPPRPWDDVWAEVQSLQRRLAGLGALPDLTGLPPRPPTPAQALDAAQAVLDVLERLQGPSDWQRVSASVLALQHGDLVRSEALARAGLQSGTDPSLRRYSRHNLAGTLIRQGRFEEALVIAHEDLERDAEDLPAMVNALTALHGLGRADDVRRITRTFLVTEARKHAPDLRRFVLDCRQAPAALRGPLAPPPYQPTAMPSFRDSLAP